MLNTMSRNACGHEHAYSLMCGVSEVTESATHGDTAVFVGCRCVPNYTMWLWVHWHATMGADMRPSPANRCLVPLELVEHNIVPHLHDHR